MCASSKSALRTNDTDRDDRIRVAVTWARLFIRESERELNRERNSIIRASAQTVAAIEAIFNLESLEFEEIKEKL